MLHRNSLPRGVLFEISGTRVPGEGEVKILRSMKTRQANPLFKGHSHLIVSEVGTTEYRSHHGIPAC